MTEELEKPRRVKLWLLLAVALLLVGNVLYLLRRLEQQDPTWLLHLLFVLACCGLALYLLFTKRAL